MARPPAAPRQAVAGSLDLIRAEVRAALRLVVLIGGIATLLTFAAIYLKLEVYRLVVPTGSIPTAIGLASGFLVVAALLVLLEHLRDLALLTAGNRLSRGLATPEILSAVGRSGDAASNSATLLGDVEEVRRAVSGPLCIALLDVALVPLGLLVLWMLHPWFAALALVSCMLAAFASLAAERRARAALRESNTLSSRTSGLVADAMRCADAVEAMGIRPALERRWLADLRRGGARMRSAQEMGRRLGASGAALQGMAAGGAMLLGAVLSLRGEDLGAGLMAAMLLTGRVIEPFARLGGFTQDWGQASAAWARLRATLEQAGQTPQGFGFPCPQGRIVLDRLTYLHPGTPRPLLREMDMVVAPGEVVAVVGPPGSGKTTLLRLMLGMHRPTAGGVFLDGHATWQWDHADLARHVGYLPQDPNLGEGSIAEAISRLAARPDLPAVLRAAALCGVDRMIAELPLGYATPVRGEQGLSMGQRQCVALARAVYGTPKLVLLDEPTAWLDAEGEAEVARTLERLRACGIGVVLSSHRRFIVDAADRVLVLGAGGTLRPALAGPASVVQRVVTLDAKPAA